MESFTLNNLALFSLFFLPGFISVKVFQIFVPSERLKTSESLLEIIGYSCLVHFLFSWLILLNIKYDWIYTHNIYFILSLIVDIVLGPILVAYLIHILAKSKFFNKHTVANHLPPWDEFFSQRRSCYIVVTYKDNSKVGGYYGTASNASIYPKPHQLYIEQVWIIDSSNNQFIKKKTRTLGVLINFDETKQIEFYKP